MSTTARTAQRGGKNTKTETSLPNKPQKPELKIEPPKALEKVQVSLLCLVKLFEI